MTRRAFEWLQVGDVRQEGDYTVSSMNGWMWTVPESMWGKPIKSLDMPVFRPIPPAADSPLKPLDPVLDTILATPPLGYRGEPAHSVPTPATFRFPPPMMINEACMPKAALPPLKVINESFGGWDAIGGVLLAVILVAVTVVLFWPRHG